MQVLPVELVQGITFGLFFPTLVSVSAKIAPTGIVTMEMMIRRILIVVRVIITMNMIIIMRS